MGVLSILAVLCAGVLYLIHRRETRDQWRQIGRMIDHLAEGERPPSFILHGERDLRRIGLGIERLAEQRERLERQISQEEFNLQAILSSVVEGVMVVDTQRCIRLVNASFLQQFDLLRAPIGRSVLQALRNVPIEEVVRTALKTSEPQSREIAVAAAGRHFAVSAAPVRDAAGAILGVAAIFHDITRLKQLEEVRREFVANVSHELRTPLSIFQGHVEWLRDNPDLPRAEQVESFQVLSKHSSRLNALVEDLLTLARLESRKDDLKLTPVWVAEFLRGIGADWKLKFNGKQVGFRLEIGVGDAAVLADSFRLEQVFTNLLENALKFTPSGGEVLIEAQAVGSETPGSAEIEIRVKDTGCGIPPADLPHIFERFYRADKARSRAMGGTGLGLAIVKHIIQQHGGTVRAESTLGSGTTIILHLPKATLLAASEVQPLA